MDPLAIGGLAGLLLVKEAGVPIPVPGDLLVIGAGAALAGDPPLALAALVVILVAGYAGGSLQFLLVRRTLRELVLRSLARFGIGRDRVETLGARLRRSGARGVAVARMTPGVRVASIAACGVAAVPFGPFVRGLVAGNGVFVSAHYALGFLLGASAQQLLAGVGTLGVALLAGLLLALLGAAGWWLLARRRTGRRTATFPVQAWADAACPACLAVALAERSELAPVRDA